MAAFKKGDRVRVKESQPDDEVLVNSLQKGRIYIVEDVDGDGLLYTDKVVACAFRFELATDSYSLKKFEKDIRKFNERCGNIDCTPEMSLADTCATVLPQAKVILEEAKELLKACEEQDEQEMVDGSIDVLVTSLRLLSLLGKRYDLMKAAELIMENNHLKYTDDVNLANRWVMNPDGSWSGFNIVTTGKDVDSPIYYCIKDDNGKIRKWTGFPKVELHVEELRK